MLKLISWNVNGMRSCLAKGFIDFARQSEADIICLQETKMLPEQVNLDLPLYHRYWNSADKLGYSGTAVFTKEKPLRVTYDFGADIHRHEGRIITLEYEKFYLVCCYTPNAQGELKRIDYRMQWEDALREYLQALDKEKPVIYCGDLNVAHQEIDLKNPQANRNNPGFSDQERGKFTELLQCGFRDTFRTLHPIMEKYSWWSYRFHAREKNIGWRIDYFVVSRRLMPYVTESDILTEVEGSDHCPVFMTLDWDADKENEKGKGKK